MCARRTPVHAERGYVEARNRVFRHALPQIPRSAGDRKPCSNFLCLDRRLSANRRDPGGRRDYPAGSGTIPKYWAAFGEKPSARYFVAFSEMMTFRHFSKLATRFGYAVFRTSGCDPPVPIECRIKRVYARSHSSIAPRRIADLALLDADPLRDIHNTTKISTVFLAGMEFDRAALDYLLNWPDSLRVVGLGPKLALPLVKSIWADTFGNSGNSELEFGEFEFISVVCHLCVSVRS